LPAMIRKMHLAKLLNEKDFEKIRNDFRINPVEGIDVDLSDDILIQKLSEFGIVLTDNGEVELRLWGTGKPRREFLHSDDLARACVYLMKEVDFEDVVKERGLKEVRNTHINIGVGEDLSIAELAGLVKEVTGFDGEIRWDSTKPDGTYQKLLDVARLNNLGFKATIELKEGIQKVYEDYRNGF